MDFICFATNDNFSVKFQNFCLLDSRRTEQWLFVFQGGWPLHCRPFRREGVGSVPDAVRRAIRLLLVIAMALWILAN